MTNKTFEDGKVILVASGSEKDSENYINEHLKKVSENNRLLSSMLSNRKVRGHFRGGNWVPSHIRKSNFPNMYSKG